MKERLRLRTTAGAWEYVLRAGLAAAERGPEGSYGYATQLPTFRLAASGGSALIGKPGCAHRPAALSRRGPEG